MASTLIDIEYQDDVDELAIDICKVDVLKTNADFIFFLFKTSIEYGKAENYFTFFSSIFFFFICSYVSEN